MTQLDVCVACNTAMLAIEPDQIIHPCCDPDDTPLPVFSAEEITELIGYHGRCQACGQPSRSPGLTSRCKPRYKVATRWPAMAQSPATSSLAHNQHWRPRWTHTLHVPIAEGGPGPRPRLAQSHHHRSADIAPPCSVRRHPSLMRPTDGTMTQWVYPSARGFSSISLLSSPAGIGRCGRPPQPHLSPASGHRWPNLSGGCHADVA